MLSNMLGNTLFDSYILLVRLPPASCSKHITYVGRIKGALLAGWVFIVLFNIFKIFTVIQNWDML